MGKPNKKKKWDFNLWAETYDKTLQEAYSSKDWMYKNYEEVLNQVAAFGKKILEKETSVVVDIGIGTGNLAKRFVGKAKQIIGIDPSVEMLQLAKKKIPAIEIKKADFLSLPLSDHSVDLIVSSYALHHLTENEKMIALEEMSRVLKKEGVIIVADLMFANPQIEKETKKELVSRGKKEIVNEIEEEYYGYVNTLEEKITNLRFHVQKKQMTEFVWIICGNR
jgi:ubiquinone/menaquinone biosynthesis C-methylase UbiE